MEEQLIDQLRRLRKQSSELCYAIESLPASERQTDLSVNASETSQRLQGWIADLEVPKG